MKNNLKPAPKTTPEETYILVVDALDRIRDGRTNGLDYFDFIKRILEEHLFKK